MTENQNFPTESFVARDQGRDLMADSIEGYLDDGGEFRTYDLADRIIRKLNQGGWWFVHGGDVERMIAQEHPYDERERTEWSALVQVLIATLALPGESVADVLERCHLDASSTHWKKAMGACGG